jgi:CrcB protein
MLRTPTCVAVGAVIRESTIAVFARTDLNTVRFSIATILLNAIGAFLLGFLSENLSKTGHWYSALGPGFCGGLTTFSTFCAEIPEMIRRGFDIEAAVYAIISISVGVSLAFLGARARLNLKITIHELAESGTSETGKDGQEKVAIELDTAPAPLSMPNWKSERKRQWRGRC